MVKTVLGQERMVFPIPKRPPEFIETKSIDSGC